LNTGLELRLASAAARAARLPHHSPDATLKLHRREVKALMVRPLVWFPIESRCSISAF